MLCEWNPEENEPASRFRTNLIGPYERHGCPNEAVFVVGVRPKWYLCKSCAELPRFKRLRKRELAKEHP